MYCGSGVDPSSVLSKLNTQLRFTLAFFEWLIFWHFSQTWTSSFTSSHPRQSEIKSSRKFGVRYSLFLKRAPSQRVALIEDFGYPKDVITTRPQFRVRPRPSEARERGYPVDITVFSSETSSKTKPTLSSNVSEKHPRMVRSSFAYTLRFHCGYRSVVQRQRSPLPAETIPSGWHHRLDNAPHATEMGTICLGHWAYFKEPTGGTYKSESRL